jgi:stearoyl-CoA desaturase (Delta-9 desaturase)
LDYSCNDATLSSEQHVFPHDYRSGPGKTDWDPSKWVIFTLAKFGIAWGLRRAIPEDIAAARARMLAHERQQDHIDAHERGGEKEEWTGPTWTEAELEAYVERNGACVMLIDGYVVDVTGYIKTHVRSLSFSHCFLNCGVCSLTGEVHAAWRCGAAA